jgi:hypothetical protein
MPPADYLLEQQPGDEQQGAWSRERLRRMNAKFARAMRKQINTRCPGAPRASFRRKRGKYFSK